MTTRSLARQDAAAVGEQARIAELEAEVAHLRAENARLAESESRLTQIVDALPVLVGYVDLNQRIVVANQAIEVWYQQPRDEIIGTRLRDLFEPDRAARSEGSYLLTQTPGYALDASSVSTDVAAFERCCASGRGLLDVDAPEAARTLREGLDLFSRRFRCIPVPRGAPGSH